MARAPFGYRKDKSSAVIRKKSVDARAAPQS
jgi:hypothetical protein